MSSSNQTPYDGRQRGAHPRIPAATVPYLTARVAGGPAVGSIDLVTYHTALVFTDELTLCAEELERAINASSAPAAPSRHRHDVTDDYTMIVMDGRTGDPLRAGGSAAC